MRTPNDIITLLLLCCFVLFYAFSHRNPLVQYGIAGFCVLALVLYTLLAFRKHLPESLRKRLATKDDIVTVERVYLIGENTDAIGITPEDRYDPHNPSGIFAWLPKRMIEYTDLEFRGQQGCVEIPRWLAEKHRLFYKE